MKKFISLMLAAILAVSAFSFASAKSVPEDTRAGFGMSIAGFSTTDLEGNPVDSSLLDNADISFINYWATWCGPCVSEMPHLNQLPSRQRRYQLHKLLGNMVRPLRKRNAASQPAPSVCHQ